MTDRRVFLTLIVLAGTLAVAGCGNDGGGDSAAERPRITATYPAEGAVDVNLNPLVEVWFDQDMDEATIDSAACHVTGAATERLEYDESGKVLRIYLRELLAPEAGYEILVDSTVTSTDGESMAEARSFAFTTGPMDCDHVEDYLEPNDNIGEAVEIEVVKAYPLLSSCGDGTPEYYRFELTDTALVTARIEHVYSDNPTPSWHVRYKRASDDTYVGLITWFSATNSINMRYTFLPGTYYLETGSSEPEGSIVVYNLILQLSAPCPDDSLEDNDFIDEAGPIGPGLTDGLRGCSYDRDCYFLRLGAGQTLTATVEQNPDIGSQLTLEILDPDGAVLTGGTYTESPAIITWAAVQDTVHYIAATFLKNNVHYSIEVDVLSLP